jgi:acyl-CoA synthetase (AMP-forming)/AMP-acid ligase II
MTHKTLVELLEVNRDVDRVVTYVEGENAERRVSYGDVHARALGILYHLQALGAQRGDKVIMFLNNNEQFLDGFWAALAGGIVPVPLAVGISDEHRQKLLRVARKLGKPYLYTDAKNLERLQALAAEAGESELMADLASRCFLVESITDISRQGKLYRPDPSDLAFIQFSSGSTSEPKGVMLTHGNLVANIEGATAIGKYSEQDVTLSWMPLTHDMGLIGFYLVLFTNRSHINLMSTDLFVRRPLLWLQTAARKRVTLTCSPNFGYRHFLKVLGDRKLEGVDLSSIRAIYNGALQRVHAGTRVHRASQERDVSGLRPGGSLPRRRVPRARHGLPLDSTQPAQARPRLLHRAQPRRCAGRDRIDVRGPESSQHGSPHGGRCAGTRSAGPGRSHIDPRTERHAGLFRRSGGDGARSRRGGVARYRRPRRAA